MFWLDKTNLILRKWGFFLVFWYYIDSMFNQENNWHFSSINILYYFPNPPCTPIYFSSLMHLSILSFSFGFIHLIGNIPSFLFLPILSFLLPRVRCYRALSGLQAAAAYHRWQEGLDQCPGAFPQAPAPEFPSSRLPGQSTGCWSNWGLLYQWISRGQH